MKISILAVGTELLMGKTVNTNATFLSKEINAIGHSVMYHLTIGDNPERLEKSLNYLLEVSDMVITTGGLGPTQDDLTKEVIAKTLHAPLKRDQKAYDMLTHRFKQFNSVMTANNIKQADLPEACIPMYNDRGTAPGFIVEKDKIVAALPGPPREMKYMFEKSLKPFLESKSESVILSEYINLFGIGESSAETVIEHIVSKQTNPTVAMYANVGQVSIRVTSSAETEDEAKMLLEPVVKEISQALNAYVIGYGQVNLLEITYDLLVQNKLQLSLAESCTGGLIASEFINMPGSSQFMDRSYVTYSNKAKIEVLKVKEKTLNTYGAVSEETCKEMLLGQNPEAISLAVTGIAGPGGGSEEKPVGLVYIGVHFKNQFNIKKFNFTGDRAVIRRRSMLHGINMIREMIINTCS